MSVGFGFSVGDFIAALSLVRDVIDALQESGAARRKYCQLLNQLCSLETSLQQVNRLELDDVEDLEAVDRHSEVAALREAAAQCHRSIDEFFLRIRDYLPHLGPGASSSGVMQLKGAWKKVQWTLCHKDDIAKLQGDVMAHTESINLLLATIQMKTTNLQNQQQHRRHESLSRKIQSSYFITMRKLSEVCQAVSNGVQQGKRLLEMTTTIMCALLRIPGQVERQQPVYLIDALGRSAPFHLEFVRSARALIAVLEINFDNVASGAGKVRRKEFSIEDVATQRDIDLEDEWETCFQPGQHVSMSMLFDRPLGNDNQCPRCSRGCKDGNPDDDDDIRCSFCGISFRRITEFEEPDLIPTGPEKSLMGPKQSRGTKRRRDLIDDELAPFRKVRIRSWVPLQHYVASQIDE